MDRTRVSKRVFNVTMAIVLLVNLASLGFSAIVFGQTPDRQTFTGLTMGPIQYTVTIRAAPSGVTTEALDSTIKQSLEQVNQLMSTYIADSDVSQFNRSDSTDWIAVDSETAAVVQAALEISQKTGGAFDVTVAPLVGLWNFGADAKSADGIQVITADQLPADDQIELVKQHVGFEKVSVRLEPPAMRKSDSMVKVDLSAIAKGYAVDRVARDLKRLGCENVLVIVGGEVYASGFASELSARSLASDVDRRWTVGIEKPSDFTREFDSAAALTDQALATSGDYRSFFLVDGQRYSHAIDPSTGRPTEQWVASVSVVAEDCMTADALATALMVCGPEKGREVCQAMGAEFLMAIRTNSADEMGSAEMGSAERPIGGVGPEGSMDSNDQPGLTYYRSDGFPSVKLELKPGSIGKKTQVSIWPALIGAVLIFGLAIAGMAVGAIFNNKPVQGSCGGLSAMKGESECGVCSQPTSDCEEVERV